MLSDRYCQCPLPLDLCEEDVYGGRDRLAAAVARLDSNGWNTDGRIYTTTWIRALAMLSPIREGILELSLSVNLKFTKLQTESVAWERICILFADLNFLQGPYRPVGEDSCFISSTHSVSQQHGMAFTFKVVLQ